MCSTLFSIKFILEIKIFLKQIFLKSSEFFSLTVLSSFKLIIQADTSIFCSSLLELRIITPCRQLYSLDSQLFLK